MQRLIAEHKALLAVLSCREQDYTVDLNFPRINVTPLDAPRIYEFAVKYLDNTEGETLFWKLAGGDEVRDVWQAWQKAGASFDLFFTAPDIPRANPNVYDSTTGLLMLASVYRRQRKLPDNRGELFQ